MKKLASFGLTVLVVLACAVPASARPAGPGASPFTLTVDRPVVIGGEQIVVTARSRYTCQWLIEWNGERRIHAGKTFSTTFTAPTVAKSTRIALNGTCFYTAPKPRRTVARSRAPRPAAADTDAQTIIVRVPPSWRHVIVITVLPPGSIVSPPGSGSHHHGGGGVGGVGLPNTGGPAFWLLLVGLASMVVGATAVRSASRRELA